jgi:hypothetical protein
MTHTPQWENAGPRLLCVSDCEPLKMNEILAMADSECKKLWENLRFAYTEPAGHPLLREEIVKTHYPVCAVSLYCRHVDTIQTQHRFNEASGVSRSAYFQAGTMTQLSLHIVSLLTAHVSSQMVIRTN